MGGSERRSSAKRRWATGAGLLAIGVVAPACAGSDPVSPGQRLAGRYDAIVWTIESTNGTIDMLAEGSHLWIELRANGTCTGEFYTPEGAAPQPRERRVSMDGSWSVGPDDVVTFQQPGDTFVQLIDWRFGADRLEGDFYIGGYTTTVVLRR